MANSDQFDDLREWVRIECIKLRMSISQQLRRMREERRNR